MKQNNFHFFVVFILLLGVTSCQKELFDQNAYKQFTDFQFMIDHMDKQHDWNLTKSSTLTITVPENVKRVQILTDNPYNSVKAEIAASGICFNNQAVLDYSIPISQNKLYLAAISFDDSYMGVIPFSYGTTAIDLTQQALEQTGTLTEPKPQTFTYLYEANFPEPEDFDYNDVVLRVSKDYNDVSYQVLLTVKLEAVGTRKQVAGGIYLGGYSYDDITKVEIVDGEQMDKEYPMPYRMFGSNDLLVRGRNGEAIIYLFEDAHWAFLKSKEEDGSIMRKKLNTTRSESEFISAIVDPITTTYCITFKNRELARSLNFNKIDPFIMEEYNSAVWEVHTYYYKFNDVMKDIFRNNASAYDNHVSWCVVVPQRDFRYPIDGMSLGTYNSKTGEIFGPYNDFAKWMQNHSSYTEWYKNITHPQLLF